MTFTSITSRLLALALCVACPGLTRAQDLPPELTGDFSDTPPARPAPPPTRPPPAPPPRSAPAPARPTPAPAPPRPTPAPAPAPAPELDAPPAGFDPELGDVGPLPPELSEEIPSEEADDATNSEDPAELEEPVAAEETTGDATDSPVRFFIGAGIGVGTLTFRRPTEGGDLVLPTSPFAASDVNVRVHLWPSEGLSFELLAAYQTSLGWVVEMDPLFALPEKVNVRAQRMELSFATVLRLSDAVSLALPVGLGFQLFTPKAHQYNLEPYAIGSALVRAEAIIKLTDTVTVRGGPELHWLGFFNNALESEGVCCSGGAVGLQASVLAGLTETFSLALAFRELRSFVPVAARFTSTERMATARIVGEL